MTYLILGDYKYLGRKIGEELVKDNTVVFLDNNLDESVNEIGVGIFGDISSEYSLRTTCSKYDVDNIIITPQKIYSRDTGYDHVKECSELTKCAFSVVSLLNTHKIKHVYLRSSYEMYGYNKKSTIKELYVGCPLTYRGASLRYMEDILRIHCFRTKTMFTSFRVFEIFGGKEDVYSEWFLPRVFGELYSSGFTTVPQHTSTIDFIHEDDVVSSICKLVSLDFCGPINIGSGTGFKIKNVVSRIKKFTKPDSYNISIDETLPSNFQVAEVSILNTFYTPKVSFENWFQTMTHKSGV
jgi:nucleoside-diphosphate-sugar epimerase